MMTTTRSHSALLLIPGILWLLVLAAGCTHVTEQDPWDNTHDPANKNFIPYAPSILSLDQKSDHLTIVHWQRNSQFDVGFEIYRKPLDGEYVKLGSCPVDSLSFADTLAVDVSKHYVYKVCTLSANGVQSASLEMEYVPQFPPPVITASADTNRTSVWLKWTNTSFYGDGFIVERGQEDTVYREIARVPLTQMDFIDRFPDTLHHNTYRVRMFTKDNISAPSNAALFEFRPTVIYQQTISPATGTPDIKAILVSHDRSIYILKRSGSLDIMDAASHRLLRTIPGVDGWTMNTFDISPDNTSLAIGYYNPKAVSPGKVCLVSVADGTVMNEWAKPRSVMCVGFSPDGKLLATDGDNVPSSQWAGGDYAISILELSTGNIIRQVRGSASVAFSPDQSMIATGPAKNEYGMHVYSVLTGTVVSTFPGVWMEGPYCLQFFNDGSRLAFLTHSNLHVWNATGSQSLYDSQSFGDYLYNMDLSPDNRYITATKRGVVYWWRAADDVQVLTMPVEPETQYYPFASVFLKNDLVLTSGITGVRVYYVQHRWKLVM